MTIVVGRRARAETQRRETATRTPPADDTRGGVPLEVLDRDDPKPSTFVDDSPPELANGVAVPGEPMESEPDEPEPDEPAPELELELEATGEGAGAEEVEDVVDRPTGGFGTAGAVTVGVGGGVAVVTVGVVSVGVVTVGVVTVGVVTVGRVTVVRVGSVGGSRASAGPTSVAVVATATAKHTIDRGLSIRLYNPHRPPGVTLYKQ